MNVGKKAAFLAAAAGALVLVGAGGASADGIGHLTGHKGVEQSNECSTRPLVGDVVVATPLTPASDITHETTCVNVSENGAESQSNHCDTSPVLGSVVVPVLVPAPHITYTTTCVNVAGAGTPGR
ncbi:hypothetical protein [Kitasatospora sp. NPDC050463]|uniref:hypothetical protein n=1 Tax=Kitasatospora sp. NPDC050463 TaxID=3155786 RepID=UPI0033F66D50